ncbi:phospholipase D family protein [Hydrogenophaga sp. PAMC20947]|uniref:phospholipase D family protein n=1 Tax=Hydrogenophaga sp. PAMC20947 TaxID=2565558 RepID=UPI00109DD449|nr:phospholipase D family protein [Hydrogenophaga sp. PAMC20947]QCB47715.1 phospholipase D family protein [Hydrogenophaga sp. PAMC20947]
MSTIPFRTTHRTRPPLCSVLALVASLSGCGVLPALEGRHETRAFDDTASTRLGQASAPPAQTHPGQSGVLALAEGREAFATRMLLAEAAERSLDVQYYIWHPDFTGTLLMQALRQAADRGVRVRLLLDDNNTEGLDEILAAMDSHANIQVRLFNPFVQRNWRWLGYLTDFGRLNRRMHNKSFTADNQATIMGGRNIGDEYFDAGQAVSFVDLDVLAVGAVVPRVSADFDRYWASASAYPVASLLPAAAPQALDALTQGAAQVRSNRAAEPYLTALAKSDFVRRLVAGELELEWTTVRLVSDDPAKGLGQAPPEALLPKRLAEVLGKPERELLLVSPYFVPTARGTEALTELMSQGVAVSVLTNSLAATDVPAVHAGYAKRRPALLAAGVKLFELKPDRGEAARSRRSDRGLAGSSGASLHAKTFALDRRRTFVGSFNLDPRSAALNTESGLVIDSPTMAAAIADVFENHLAARAYTLRLNGEGRIEWLDRPSPAAPPQLHPAEPQTRLWKRTMVKLLSWLPIEWLL